MWLLALLLCLVSLYYLIYRNQRKRPFSSFPTLPPANTLKHIQIVGSAGTGKSTLARELAKRLSLTYIRFDDYKSILPKWQTTEREEFERRVGRVCEEATNGWICDGNYHTLYGQELLKDCSLVIWLDYDFSIILWRLAKRSVQQGSIRNLMHWWLPLLPIIIPVKLLVQYYRGRERTKRYSKDLKQLPTDLNALHFLTPAECEAYMWKLVR
jgi:adenylate kinase family enzyme